MTSEMNTAVQLYRLPAQPNPRPLTAALLSLPPELQTRIFTYLSTDDLGVLSRCVPELGGVEEDAYLRRIWFQRTAPARVDWALFSPVHSRPGPEELVRRGTLRGIAIVSGVRSGGYWASESAVRLSRIHAKLQSNHIRQLLTLHLSPSVRPAPTALYARRILPSPRITTSASISARAFELERRRAKEEVQRKLSGTVGGKTFGEVMERMKGVWSEDGAAGEWVRRAICPCIREKRKFWEEKALGLA